MSHRLYLLEHEFLAFGDHEVAAVIVKFEDGREVHFHGDGTVGVVTIARDDFPLEIWQEIRP